MAKKTNRPDQGNKSNPSLPLKPSPVARAQAKPQVVKEKKSMSPLMMHVLAAGGIAIITFLVMKACLLNQFTNWDDPGYVVNNPVIKDLSADGIVTIFKSPIMGNYHPLTILTYAFDYSIKQLDPHSFHLQSLLWHILTTLLVYCFVQLLTGRMIAAAVTALLFGLHPMHVESVAWVSGRKDVVYGAFYIASCIVYLYYIRTAGNGKWKWYALTVLFFIAALLAKPVAVVLPIALLLIDLYEGRIWKQVTLGGSVTDVIEAGARKRYSINFLSLYDKLLLLALSLWAGYKSLQDQKVFGALGTQDVKYGFFERIGLGGYALITYLWKAVLPIKLLCFYPYPLKEHDALSPVYYLYPLGALALVFLVWKFASRNRVVVFGALFFLVNIALLLQFIPVGGAIIADRYSYIPYLGLFFIAGMLVSSLYEQQSTRQAGRLAIGAVLGYCGFIAYLSNERCKVWYDAMSLWRDEIEIEPMRAPNGYNNLGFFYYGKFNSANDPREKKLYYDSSYFLLTEAIRLQPDFINPYISLGELQRSNGQFAEAKVNYYKALKLADPKSDQISNAYLGLAITYSIDWGMTNQQYMQAARAAQVTDPAKAAGGGVDQQAIQELLRRMQKDYDSAMYSYGQTLTLKPYYPEAHSNLANFLDMTGKKDSAIIQYGWAVQQNPDIVPPYLNRARALQRMHRCDEAFKDFNKAITMEPEMGELYYARSFCFAEKGDKAKALQDVEKSISLGFRQIDQNYYNQLKH